MTEYIIIFILLFLSIYFKKNKTLIYITAAYMLFIGTFRDFSVGTDVQYYYYNYVYMNSNVKSWNAQTYFEPGFNYLTLLFKTYITKDYMTYISFLFLYTFSLTFWFFKKYSENLSLSLYSLFAFGTLCFFMNGMRQSFAFATCLIPLHIYIQNKQKIKFIISIIAISLAFHSSTLLFTLIPFLDYFIVKTNINKKKIYLMLGLSLLFSIVFRKVLLAFLGNFASLFGRFSGYILNTQELGITTSLYLSSICFLTVFFCKNCKDRFLMIYITGIILYNIFASFSLYSFRAALPFLFISGICHGNVSEQLSLKKKIIFGTIIILSGLFYFYHVYILKGQEEIYPYSQRNLNITF